MPGIKEIRDIIEEALSELREADLEPDLLLAGPGFLRYSGEALKDCRLKVYRIEELGYDAVVADSGYLGQVKRGSKRISVEPLLEEKEVWKQLKDLEV